MLLYFSAQSQYIKKLAVEPITSDATWLAYDAFNNNFLDKKTHIYKLNPEIANGANLKKDIGAIWTQAMYWDMATNAYLRAKNKNEPKYTRKYKALVEQIFKGVDKHYLHFDWHNQDPNDGWFIYDDIMWWSISLSRNYGIFRNKEYLKLANESFCRVWHGSYRLKDRGSFDSIHGGMFWNWNNKTPSDNSDNGKMACINFPTVIAALNLYNNIPSNNKKYNHDDTIGFGHNPQYPRWHSKKNYLENAKAIYTWAVNNLYNKASGAVADSRHGNGADWTTTLYNQGTFIGASCLMFKATGDSTYLKNAIQATDYVRFHMSSNDLFFPYKFSGEEPDIYTAIFAQYAHVLIYEYKQSQYNNWIQNTINNAWNHRDNRNLVNNYLYPKDNNFSCYEASATPALMLLFK